MRELPNLFLQLPKYLPPFGSNSVVLTYFSAYHLTLSMQVASLFHRMQYRVEGTRTQVIAVLAQFLNHFQTEDALLCRMVKNVHANKAEESVTKDIAQWNTAFCNGRTDEPFRFASECAQV